MMKRIILEMGTGNDLYGEDYTKAACRAVEDALWHNSLNLAEAFGFEKSDILWIKVAILFSCLPIAANVFALSQFYNAYSGRSATAIMGTTIIACITVPLTLFFLTNLG